MAIISNFLGPSCNACRDVSGDIRFKISSTARSVDFPGSHGISRVPPGNAVLAGGSKAQSGQLFHIPSWAWLKTSGSCQSVLTASSFSCSCPFVYVHTVSVLDIVYALHAASDSQGRAATQVLVVLFSSGYSPPFPATLRSRIMSGAGMVRSKKLCWLPCGRLIIPADVADHSVPWTYMHVRNTSRNSIFIWPCAMVSLHY
ncbi:uncharacterized protein P884DRAFT_80601 [Thermothelomyces heterothallicus CBS 202.75]|uniref:uncharacterized protein n=1 Tax=Thermothelomyces heterothallicus CBS 202.75 TaxID=1149848 RepID=UPI003743DED0